ncbi:hypothetical protein GOBAR_AA32529 [Gossypium barbadense]|uniref:SAWADEE domain-containing protein n=1 Tax=Gossypium barbadense TaxID=3634 RepID=A0A2P5WAS1_GOSBA|nr:hypothetical protein GOBAR_AA32529 [Gossypium barbadense]
MEKLLVESTEPIQSKEFCQKIARSFRYKAGLQLGRKKAHPKLLPSPIHPKISPQYLKLALYTMDIKVLKVLEASSARAGKPIVKWTEMGGKIPDLSELKFEAKSSKDGAWYDVDMFLTHRFLSSGEAEVRVRFVGFGAEDDEWVNVKKAVRERSIPFEHSECNKVTIGDLVLCLQERRDQSIYYDAHVVKIERKTHDIRGCRCLFLIRYNHDNSEIPATSKEYQVFPLKLQILIFLGSFFARKEFD